MKSKLFLGLAAVLAFTGCAAESESDEKKATEEAVTSDDVVDVDDLTIEDADASGAAKVGEPASLLKAGRDYSKKATNDVKAVLAHVKAVVAGKTPTRTGKTADGKAFGVWEKADGGVTYKLVVVRLAEGRVRYFLAGKKGADAYLSLMTGIFVKKAARSGGGRMHLSLTNAAKLNPNLKWNGSIHVWFATHKGDFRGRRVAYKGVKPTDNDKAPPANYVMDFIHEKGKGGRIRVLGVGEKVVENRPGVEAIALRIRWKNSVGGRADAVLMHVEPKPVAKIGELHECWDKGGMRKAYKDDIAANDGEDANEGKTETCDGFDEEKVAQAAAAEDGGDKDAELDALLKDAGAADIPEADADAATDPAP